MSLSVRYAKREELERINELRRMVNELHAENCPDIFLPGFCGDFSNTSIRFLTHRTLMWS